MQDKVMKINMNKKIIVTGALALSLIMSSATVFAATNTTVKTTGSTTIVTPHVKTTKSISTKTMKKKAVTKKPIVKAKVKVKKPTGIKTVNPVTGQ